MIKHYAWICTMAIAVFLCLYPFSAGAVPKEVTIYPESAQILEETKAHLNPVGKDLQRAVFFLPGQADPNSLVTCLTIKTGLRIKDQTWRQVIRRDDEKINKLRKQIQTLKSERNTLQSIIFSLETQIQFWQYQTKTKSKTLPESINMASSIGKNIQKAYQNKLYHDTELEKLNKQLKGIGDELNQTVAQKETFWEVTILFSGPKMPEALLTYRYFLSGCGWQSMYRIDARVREKQILFSWEAAIWQNSGQDWNEVDLNISTPQPVSSIAPPDLIPLVIKQRSLSKNNSGRRSKKTDTPQTITETENQPETLPSVPDKVGRGTFSLWRLGKKTLPTGLRQRFKIKENVWPADFICLIRPSLSSQAFIRATTVNLHESIEISHGEATFMIDGSALGTQAFSFTGQEGVFFFGIDPFVTANLFYKPGTKTFFENKQVYKLDLVVDVQNTGTFPVKVRIEEPCPLSNDDRVKLSFQCDPPISVPDNEILIWTFDMAAGQKKSIFTAINITAPKNMNLDQWWQ